jgi:cadmium resistance protein CadD (predicted permease)
MDLSIQRTKTVKTLIQLGVGAFVAVASLVLLVLMAFSEINFKDLTFGTYFGLFATLAAIGFFVLTRNDDNEETNPGKESPRK